MYFFFFEENYVVNILPDISNIEFLLIYGGKVFQRNLQALK